MTRWLVALVVVLGALAAGTLAFLNGGVDVDVRLTTGRFVRLPLGAALAGAFVAGASVVALLALAGALARGWRARRDRIAAERAAARLQQERLRAERLLAGGEADGARVRLAEAVTTHGPNEQLLDLLAGAAEQTGDLAGAIAALEQEHARQPGSPVLTRRLRALYAAAGRWEEALALQGTLLLGLRSAGTLADEARVLCGLRYEAAMADGDAPRGLRRLLALTREHPAFVPAWVAAGDRLRAAGRRFRARRAYERGARIRPAGVLLDRLLAFHAATGHPDRGLGVLRRLGRRYPHDASIVVHLARRLLHAGALDDTDAALVRWPADTETPPAIEALRGELCRRRGLHEQAAAHLARAAAAHLGTTSVHRCRVCGHPSAVWTARCEGCGRWDTVASQAEIDHAISSDVLM